MSDGWDTTKELADQHGISGLFVRLADDGDKVVGAFLGDPYPREMHWAPKSWKECPEDSCNLCVNGERPSLRVSINFYVLATKNLKIIEGGVMWFNDIVKARKNHGLDKTLFEIERHGAAHDTRTRYTILPKRDQPLTPELKQEIDGLRLYDLPKVLSGGGNNGKSHNSRAGTIDPRTASHFTARLKTLPVEAATTFVERFDVQRIRDVKAADEDSARAFIETLEIKYGPADSAAETEVDPFA